jgi:hypothetical protein
MTGKSLCESSKHLGASRNDEMVVSPSLHEIGYDLYFLFDELLFPLVLMIAVMLASPFASYSVSQLGARGHYFFGDRSYGGFENLCFGFCRDDDYESMVVVFELDERINMGKLVDDNLSYERNLELKCFKDRRIACPGVYDETFRVSIQVLL